MDVVLSRIAPIGVERVSIDGALIARPEVLAALNRLKEERKFEAEVFYPGAVDERVRARCEGVINEMIDALVLLLPTLPKKSDVLAVIALHLQSLSDEDTEEREQAASYSERIVEIIGMASSDGLLNRWVYGFDPSF